jgi:hypothetical protein
MLELVQLSDVVFGVQTVDFVHASQHENFQVDKFKDSSAFKADFPRAENFHFFHGTHTVFSEVVRDTVNEFFTVPDAKGFQSVLCVFYNFTDRLGVEFKLEEAERSQTLDFSEGFPG